MGLELQPDGTAGLAGHCQPDKKQVSEMKISDLNVCFRRTSSHPQHWCQNKKLQCLHT